MQVSSKEAQDIFFEGVNSLDKNDNPFKKGSYQYDLWIESFKLGELTRKRRDRKMNLNTYNLLVNGESYDRARDLPKVMKISLTTDQYKNPDETFAKNPGRAMEVTRQNVEWLEHALRAERVKKTSNHWTYNHNQHANIRKAYYGEQAILTELQNKFSEKRQRHNG